MFHSCIHLSCGPRRELQRRLRVRPGLEGETRVRCFSVTPGAAQTNIMTPPSVLMRPLLWAVMRSATVGAQVSARKSPSPNLTAVTTALGRRCLFVFQAANAHALLCSAGHKDGVHRPGHSGRRVPVELLCEGDGGGWGLLQRYRAVGQALGAERESDQAKPLPVSVPGRHLCVCMCCRMLPDSRAGCMRKK